jgi:hypothetical protein
MKSSNAQLTRPTNGATREIPEVFGEAARAAMERAVREAVAEHHRAGNPVAVWQDGRVMLLYPDGSLQPPESP